MQDMSGQSPSITRNDTSLEDTHKDIYVLTGAVIALCSIVLLGWTFQFGYLISPNSNWAAMVPSTAALMIGAAVALILTLSVMGPRTKWLVWTLACLVVLPRSVSLSARQWRRPRWKYLRGIS